MSENIDDILNDLNNISPIIIDMYNKSEINFIIEELL